MTTRHVLFVITSANKIGPKERPTGFFFPEVAHPFHELQEAGFAVEFASLAGGAPPEDGYDASDLQQKSFRESRAYVRMQHSRKLSEVDVLGYDAVFVPGGLGPMVDMADDPLVKSVLGRAYDAGLVVGAVCHGPVALLGVRLADGTPLLRGRRVTGFSNAEEDGYAHPDVPFLLQTALEEQGAVFEQAAPWQPKAVVDGRLVTGQNPASAAPMAKAMVELLRSGS